jgi:hypothetical protein
MQGNNHTSPLTAESGPEDVPVISRMPDFAGARVGKSLGEPTGWTFYGT